MHFQAKEETTSMVRQVSRRQLCSEALQQGGVVGEEQMRWQLKHPVGEVFCGRPA